MTTITCDSWSDFITRIRKIRRDAGPPDEGHVLFRGQANAEWSLLTTLERRVPNREFTVVEYAQIALACAHKLKSETHRTWDMITNAELQEWSEGARKFQFNIELPCYPYMVYLRQHGFASPLLDWTESPFVAAYFAFHEPAPAKGHAAVYVYREFPNDDSVKVMSLNEALISLLGPSVETHPRHFAQQAWYTICGKWDDTTTLMESPRGHVIRPHSEVFAIGRQNQDVLVQLRIPRSERRTALEFLKDANINHFTLFRTEDALVRAVDVDAFDLSPIVRVP